MSDDLRRVVDDLKGSLRGVYERMERMEDAQRKAADETAEVKR